MHPTRKRNGIEIEHIFFWCRVQPHWKKDKLVMFWTHKYFVFGECWSLCLYAYHWVDTSADGLLVPDCTIHTVVSGSPLTWFNRGRRGGDNMVVGFTTTRAISAYHHWSCEFEPPSWRGVLDTTVCQWLETGRLFSPCTLVSSTNKTDRHDITEILLKVALNTIKQTKAWFIRYIYYAWNLQFLNNEILWKLRTITITYR
jgi:hypothetical protein